MSEYGIRKVMLNDGDDEINPRWVWMWVVVRMDGSWLSRGYVNKSDAEQHMLDAVNRRFTKEQVTA